MARNILVVEDDRNISELIRMYLEKEGFEVRLAYDGGKAVEEYDKRAPDMVLLDIMLPVMDGWAVCAHIREKGKTPIIMLTAKSDVGDRITGLEMGADDYLVKPFEMKELMARINAVLRRCCTTWRPRPTASTPAISCWTRCGASIILATAVPWTYTSSACGRRSRTFRISGSSRPCGAWATSSK